MVTTRTLKVLYHPDRRRILDVLTARGASRVGDIASALDMQVGSISHHLRMLESEGFVERADDLRTDGRTSWWRSVPRSFAWSVDDFADDGSDAALARDLERANIQYQAARLAEWKRRAPRASLEWRQAAFSSDTVDRATPDELRRLSEALAATVFEWRRSIDADDGQEREAVRVFTHAFPQPS
ncbi:MAG: ArsR/SmtB family transcription factor [Candidatus Microbacterium stercoravium]